MGSPPRRVMAAVLLGTVLNPLNSSLIAVALVPLHQDFHVGLGAVTWLISGFYLAGAVGQPLMGRLAEHLGPRRVFLAGLMLVGALSALAPFAPSIGWLVAIRVLQAFGSSSPYPAGLALIRATAPRGAIPASALGALSVAGSLSAALGPALGGLLLAVAGWQAIFLVNVPLTALGLLAGWSWLPSLPATEPGAGWTGLDLPGAALFAATLTALLGFLLADGAPAGWLLLAVVPVAGGLLVVRELNVASPFLDLRMLAANRPLVSVYLQFAGTTLVFYSVFFGVPIWLEQARGFDAATAGLLMLPITGMGVLVTPAAAWLVNRAGPRPPVILGSLALTAGSLLLLTYGPASSPLAIVAVAFVLGIPNAFNNIGLQAALYEAAPPERVASAGGQFQTFRYIGAILSTSLLAVAFGRHATAADLHLVALAIAGLSALLVVASLLSRRWRPVAA